MLALKVVGKEWSPQRSPTRYIYSCECFVPSISANACHCQGRRFSGIRRSSNHSFGPRRSPLVSVKGSTARLAGFDYWVSAYKGMWSRDVGAISVIHHVMTSQPNSEITEQKLVDL